MKLISTVVRPERLPQVKAALCMRAALFSLWLLAPAALVAQSAPPGPADTTGKKADPPPAPAAVNHLETSFAGFKLTGFAERSEEHTSELQSPCNLVCRLLLEKKKKKAHNIEQA